MNKKKKSKYLIFDKHFIIITMLALGTVLVLSVSNQQTQIRQQASRLLDLNTAAEIESFINTDGTMGPKTPKENFSNQLPASYLGDLNLNFKIGQNSLPKSTNLSITISKVEVHLIHLFIPGANDPYNSRNQKEGAFQKTNQNVNKWETLELNENSDPFDINFIDGQTYYLGTTPLAGGKYSEIRLYISKATTLSEDGKKIELIIPDRLKIIRVAKPFNIISGKTTTLTLDFDKKNSIISAGNNLLFKPVISNISITN